MAKDRKPEPKVRLVKLVSGEVLIAATQGGAESLKLNKPLLLIAMPHPEVPNKSMVQLMDFVPGMEGEDLDINRKHVICTTTPRESIADLYNQSVNPSPIAQPPEKKLLLPGQMG